VWLPEKELSKSSVRSMLHPSKRQKAWASPGKLRVGPGSMPVPPTPVVPAKPVPPTPIVPPEPEPMPLPPAPVVPALPVPGPLPPAPAVPLVPAVPVPGGGGGGASMLRMISVRSPSWRMACRSASSTP
jgi:hypothetical protein